ncbi:MAG: tRNA(Met) cytidine acetyltransferase TmcA domain-containing protein, partial [Bradymonadia bacterium]
MWQRLSSSSDYDTLREHLESGHRALLSLVGAPAWALETSSAFFHWAGIEQYQIASNSKTLSSNVILPSVAYQYLGRQFGGLFFDLSDALHPDALAALIGCVTGGGLVILYWGDSLETRPVETHLKVETVSMAEIGHRLRQRVLKFAQTAEHFCLFATDPIDLLKKPFRTRMDPRPIQWTNDQEIALAKILKVTLGRRRRPLMLEAPRGRGKSTILAEAILQTIAQKNCGITVI